MDVRQCSTDVRQQVAPSVTPDEMVFGEGLLPLQNGASVVYRRRHSTVRCCDRCPGVRLSLRSTAPDHKSESSKICGSTFTLQPPATTGRDFFWSVQKGVTLVLEVDALGFRLLKPRSFDAIRAFGWGEIHSWLHSPGRFSFRFYEEKYLTSSRNTI